MSVSYGQFYLCWSEPDTPQHSQCHQRHLMLELVAMGMLRFLADDFNKSVPGAHAKFHSSRRITS